MKDRIAVVAVISAVAALSGCSGGGGGGGPIVTFTPPPVVSFSHAFPVGGTFSTQGTPWNIVGVKTTLTGVNPGALGNSYDTLRVDVTFAQDISNALPPPGGSLEPTLLGGNELGVVIGFNTDGNSGSGYYAFCTNADTQKPYKYETASSSRLNDGNYSILGSSGFAIYLGSSNPFEEAIVAVNGNQLSETVQLGTIMVNSGTRVPHVGVALLSQNGFGATSCVPSASDEIYSDQQAISP